MSNENETTAPASASAKKKVPTWVWVVGGLFVLGLISQAFGGGDSPSENASPEDSAVVAEEEPTDSPSEEVAPVAQEFENIEALTAAIEQTIGSQTAEGADRALDISFQETAESEEDAGWLLLSYARDESMDRADVWTETERIFLLARQAEFVKSLTFILTTVIENNLGEEVEVSAFVANFDRDTFSRIVTENVVGDEYENAVTDYSFDSRVRWGN
jgi:hypothetical protein